MPQAEVGKVPAPSLAPQCQSSVGVSPWDNGNHYPNVIICCGGHVDFQWSVRLSTSSLTRAVKAVDVLTT